MNDFLKEKAEAYRAKQQEELQLPNMKDTEGRAVRGYFAVVMMLLLVFVGAMPVYAATTDPLAIINNLSSFIFGAIQAIGIIMIGFAVVQIGLSLKSHDASQRANGLMTFFGGVLIAFSKNILDLILA